MNRLCKREDMVNGVCACFRLQIQTAALSQFFYEAQICEAVQ